MRALEEALPLQFPVDVPLDQFDGHWWVAHTKPRQEKALARDVLRTGGQYFLPMYQAVRRRRGRSWNARLVLFPGYIFLCGGPDERSAILRTGRVANAIDVGDEPRLVEELSGIRRMLDSPMAVDPYRTLTKGTCCRIRCGPLAGLVGRVERRKKRTRFVLEVSILGQGASVEIDADVLEPV